MHILIVEDDALLNAGLCYSLELEEHTVNSAINCVEAKKYILERKFDLAILDVNLPEGNGFEICELIKKSRPETAVIFLSANTLEKDILNGYNVGAEDYVLKPFSINILLKKVQVIANRSSANHMNYRSGMLEINFHSFSAMLNRESIVFTPTEYKVLKLFTENQNVVLTRNTMLEKLYDINSNFVDDHALSVNINRIRGKIETEKLKYIKTIYGVGYMWIGETEVD